MFVPRWFLLASGIAAFGFSGMLIGQTDPGGLGGLFRIRDPLVRQSADTAFLAMSWGVTETGMGPFDGPARRRRRHDPDAYVPIRPQSGGIVTYLS